MNAGIQSLVAPLHEFVRPRIVEAIAGDAQPPDIHERFAKGHEGALASVRVINDARRTAAEAFFQAGKHLGRFNHVRIA